MSCNVRRPISREVLRIFQSTEGSLSAKLHITISRFDVRGEDAGEASVRRHTYTHAHPLSRIRPVYSGVSPCGIRQGYRGCSGVLLVVIGVGPTDHLNTRYCNHDSPPPLTLSFSFCQSFLTLPPPSPFHLLPGLTLSLPIA